MKGEFTRRAFLGTALATGSATLSGCTWLRSLLSGSQFDPDEFLLDCSSSKLNPVFDAHGHFFNASDLQAGGYLTGPMLNHLLEYRLDRRPALQRFVKELGQRVQDFADSSAISASRELSSLSQRYPKRDDLFDRLSAESIDARIAEAHLEASRSFFSVMSSTKSNRNSFQSAYEEALREAVDEDSRSGVKGLTLTTDRNLLSPEFTEDTIYQAMSLAPLSEAKSFGRSVKSSIDTITGLLSFVGRMLTYRGTNIDEYRRGYNKAEGVSVIGTTDVLVDFDYWLGCRTPASSFADQVALHDRLAELSNGFVMPLLGFNPWKYVIEGEDYLKRIESALTDTRFVGIKIYPTLGYGPDGSMTKPIVDDLNQCSSVRLSHAEAEKKVQHALFHIYSFCVKNNFVVMAHSNHSQGVSRSSIDLAGPANWKCVLDEFPTLKVNLGHLGTLETLDNDDWTAEFLKMMASDEHPNLHGDIGYWDSVSEVTQLATRLEALQSESPNVLKKIMYGSDWFMISKEPGWKGYLEQTYAILESKLETENLDRVAFTNGANFFQFSSESCELSIENAERYI